MDEPNSSTEKFEEALKRLSTEKYTLRLYVAGMGTKSIQAIENIKRLCDEVMPGGYQLDIIDIYQQPIFAKEGQIVAAPTLIKELPLPLRKLVGDMSDTEHMLVGMDIRIATNGKGQSAESKSKGALKPGEGYD
jgi:circadian clock protein KaiB